MNKREVVWLIVRLIGVYFAYLAVVTVFTVVSSVYALYSLSGDPAGAMTETESVRPASNGFSPPGHSDSEPRPAAKTDPVAEKAKSEAFKMILFYIFLTGLYGGIGFYLIAKGKILFNILNNENAAPRHKEPAVTTLKL